MNRYLLIGQVLLLGWGLFGALSAQISFTEIATEAGIDHYYKGVNDMGAGAAFFDMDNDGDEDLWLSGGLNQDALYENDGKGNFTEIGDQAGLWATSNMVTTGVITGDLNNDGLRDVLIITHIGSPNFIMRNNGDKTFERQYLTGLEPDEAYSLAAAMADINQDGLLDIYAGHYIEKDRLDYSPVNPDSVVGFSHQCYANKLYINKGNWRFEEVSETWQAEDKGCALATAFTDYDGDFDPDLLIANDFGHWVFPNALLENNQSSFTNISTPSGMDVGIYGMGIAIGDYDNDLDLDYYITNLGENVLLRNEGDGTFSNQTVTAGVGDKNVTENLLATGWGTAFIDFDNDTDLDLYVVNGYVPAAAFIANAKANPNRCFENDGQGNFTNVLNQSGVESPERGRGLAYADIDNDGDIDFLVANVNRQATPDTIQKVQLYRNDTPGDKDWFKIRLRGTQNNRDGLGSQIKIKVNGQWYLQEANGGYGTHASQNSSIIHFGLGNASSIDSLVIIWQGGHQQVFTQLAVNQLVTVEEEGAVTSLEEQRLNASTQLRCYPNPFHETISIEYLLPQKSRVMLEIYDQLGRVVWHQNFTKEKGNHSLTWKAPGKGIYFIRMKSEHFTMYESVLSK